MLTIKSSQIHAHLEKTNDDNFVTKCTIEDDLNIATLEPFQSLVFRDCEFQGNIFGVATLQKLGFRNSKCREIDMVLHEGKLDFTVVTASKINLIGNSIEAHFYNVMGADIIQLIGSFKCVSFTVLNRFKPECETTVRVANADIAENISFSDCHDVELTIMESEIKKDLIINKCDFVRKEVASEITFIDVKESPSAGLIEDLSEKTRPGLAAYHTTVGGKLELDHVTLNDAELRLRDVSAPMATFALSNRISMARMTSCTFQTCTIMKLKTLVFSIDKTKIAEPLKLENCEIGFMTASASDLDKGAKYNNVRIFDGDREALRLQKTYLQSISNNVELLTIKAKELHAHRLELWRDLAIWDSLSLWLNEKSNLYGTRWQRGVEFTFYVSVGFYCIYLATLRDLPFTWGYVNWDSFCKASGTTIKYYFRFLGLTHELNFMEDFKPRAVSYAVDTIGRIFVGYGIYQTAAAFRKYGKGE